ncbi:MAG: accessory gene regulator B family protein [Peptococcaceae bacterium]|nr:accessory gene regulator B family protein [Peptococcaceae bacterium]
MNRVVSILIDKMIDGNIINSKEKKIYFYGLTIFFSFTTNIVAFLMAAKILGLFINCLFFLTAFIPLRLFAGGYHANTKIYCYTLSIITYSVFFILLKSPLVNLSIMILITSILSLLIIAKNCPMIHKNRLISNYEFKRYKLISWAIILIDFFFLLIIFWLNLSNSLIFSFSFGIIIESLSILMTKFNQCTSLFDISQINRGEK